MPRAPKRSDHADDELAVAQLARALEAENQRRASRAALPYDGVVGRLPSWVPPGIAKAFTQLRDDLLCSGVCGEAITPLILQLWMDRYARLGEADADDHIPPEVLGPIGQLAHWRYAVSLGPTKGLKLLGVPSAKFLGRKRGATQSETAYVAELRRKYPKEPVDDLYRTLIVIAQTPSDRRNPTPGACPFATEYRGGVKPVLLKRGKPYPLNTFRNAITAVDKRIAQDAST